MPIQLSGSLVITGSITTTGVITMSGSIASASYSSTSDLLQGTGSVGFTTTASFNAVSSSQQQISASYIALSASYNTFSGSASTRITENSSSIQQVSSSQQQISASLLNVIAIGATTGSNSFRANQSITGSLVVSSTITAQTLVVQTVTSSIVYSSGSNVFGNQLSNTQTFTGSVNITGSTTLNGALTGTSATFNGDIAYNNVGNQNLIITSGAANNGRMYIYSAGNADIGFQASGSSWFFNKLGIGTNAPSNKLEVIVASSNSGVSTSGIAISDGAANRTLMFLGVNTAGYTYIQSNQDNVSSQPLVLQGSGGNVYIGGTSADFGKLDITVTPSSYTAALGLGLKTNSGEGNSVGISFKTKVSLSGVIWENARIAAFTDAISSSAYGALAFYTMNATTLSERMRIGNNGYVGIGIESPTAKLHVNGTIMSAIRSNTIDTDDGVSNNFQGYSGYWALRTDNSNRFNLDVYNSGTPITALQLSLAGESTFSKSITATGLYLSCSTGVQKIAAARLFTANTTTYYDTTIGQAGMLIINSSNDRAGVFVVSVPGAGSNAISEIGDPSSFYSTTCNNANTVNFFFSGGSGNLIMQNCSGTTRDFSITHVGTP